MKMNELENTNRVADIYLKTIIPLIRNQKVHRYFDWNDTIDYLIDRLNEMRDNDK